jgi:hypothetical protein
MLLGQPFGHAEDGQPIDHVRGPAFIRLIHILQEQVGHRADQNAPTDLPPAERAERRTQAQTAALDELVTRLNAAIADPRFHVSRASLLDPAQSYSHEFWLLTLEHCRDLTGDEQFFFHLGAQSIADKLVTLAHDWAPGDAITCWFSEKDEGGRMNLHPCERQPARW